jgi:hypothetical protein
MTFHASKATMMVTPAPDKRLVAGQLDGVEDPGRQQGARILRAVVRATGAAYACTGAGVAAVNSSASRAGNSARPARATVRR